MIVGSRPPGGRGRAGFVLPVVLLMLLGVTALVHGALLLARHQRAASASGAAALQARLAAEAGVLRAARELDRGAVRRLRLGREVRFAERPFGGRARFRAHVAALGGEWLWVEAEGTADLLALHGRRRTARIYWLLDPAARVRELPAAVEHGGEVEVSTTSTVRGGGPLAAPEEWPPTICRVVDRRIDVPAERLPASARNSEPEAVRSEEAVARIPRLGLMAGRDLVERADLRLRTGAAGTPRPVVRLGACEGEDAWNWGEPLEPASPCGDRRPLVVATGPLTLKGGRGQGVLAIAGDLTLDGTRFVGLVLVGGSLRLAGGARIDGAVRVRGAVALGEGSIVAGSRCAVHRSLAVRPRPAPPLPAPEGSWIPLHGG